MSKGKTFNTFVREYLGGDLPNELAQTIDFSTMGSAGQSFILRMLNLMGKAGQSATDFNPWLIWELATVIPRILPGVLGGIIPPFTNPGRHEVFDAYIKKTISTSKDRKNIFVDIGCGLPPLTTVETAANFPGWEVYGIDRNFAPFVVIDSHGHYGYFSRNGVVQYMHPRFGAPGTSTFHNDPDSTRDRFKSAFDSLLPLLETTTTATSSVEGGGYKLIHNAIREYETGHLTFLEAEIEHCLLPPAHVVRSMNMLLYFDQTTRIRIMTQAGNILDVGGVLLAGTNHGSGSYRRYVVYKKEGDHLHPVEFAFSLDALRPLSVVPWFTIHEDDPEAALLSELLRATRGDTMFWGKFSDHVDSMLEQDGICRRGEDGFLISPKLKRSLAEKRKLHHELWLNVQDEGYVDGAVEALCKAGYNAFKNEVGDIAIRPGDNLNFPTLTLA